MAEKIGLTAVLDLSDWSKNVGKYTNDIGRMEKNTAGIGGRIGSSFQGIGKAVLGVTAAIGVAAGAAAAAIGAFAIGGIQKAANLEAQLSSIAATLNTTREQIAPLKDLIMNLALDPNLVVSTTEAAEAVENLARNGLSMQQILDGAAKSTVLLANATGADFGMAADIATDVMAQFNIEAENMGHAVDQITGVTNLSKFTIDDYRLAIAQAGGVASSVGVSFEDFNTSIASTSTLFASGSDAGTSFKTFLTSLNPKSAEAAELMKTLGLNFFDAQGQMKSMADIAEELNRVMFDEVTFTSQVNNMTAEQIAQKKALESTLKSTSMELFKYQVGVNGVAQSEEDKAVSIDRLNRKHEAAMQAYSGLATSMGTTVSITRELTEAERMQMAQTIFGSDAMRTAFGLAEAGAVIYTDVATAVKELGVSQEEVNKVIEGGVTQFEALQLQMAQIDAEEQAAERMRNFKGVIQILQGALEALQIMIGDAFLPVLTELAKMANDLVAAYGPSLIKPFQDFGTAIGTFVTAIKEGQTPLEAFKTAMAGFGETGTAIADGMIAASLAIGGFFVVVGMILEPITTAIGRFVEWKDVLIVLAGAVLSVVVPAIAGMIAAMAPIILIVGGAILAVAALRTAWETDWLGIKTAVTGAVTGIQEAFTPFTTAIQTHMQGALTEVQAFVSGNDTEFTNLKAIWEAFQTSVQNVLDAISASITEALPGWKKEFDKLTTETFPAIGQALDVMKGHWDELGVGITAFATTIVAAQIPTLFGNIVVAVQAARIAILAALATINLPLLALAVAVAVLAAAWQGNWFGMRDAVAQFVEGSKRQWKQLKTELTTLKTVFETFQSGSARQWEQLGAEIRLFVSGSKRQWEELKKDVGGVKEFLTTFQSGSARQWEQLGAEISIFVSGSKRQWAALKSDLTLVGTAFETFKQGSVRQWEQLKAEIEAIDWYALGSGIITKIWNGIELMKALITGTFTSIVDTAQDKLVNPAVSWFTRGMDIVRNIRDGIVALATDLISRFGTMIANAVKKITDTDWVGLGVDIVQGLIRGIAKKAQDFIDKVKGMAQDAVDAVTGVLDMQSPSKVMIGIGHDIMEGWIIGLEDESGRLFRVMQNISSRLVSIASAAAGNATSTLMSLASKFVSGGDPFFDIAGVDSAAGQKYQEQKSILDMLKRQADLVNAVRDAGLDVEEIFEGLSLGVGENQFDMLAVANRVMEKLADQLRQTIRASVMNAEEWVDRLRQERKTVEQIEAEVANKQIDQLTQYKNQLVTLDKQIADAESAVLAYGRADQLALLHTYQNQRQLATEELKLFLEQTKDLEERIKQATGGKNLGTQFTESVQKTLAAIYGTGVNSGQRQTLIDDLLEFATQAGQVAVDLQAAIAVSPFAAQFKEKHLDPIYERLMDINLATSERNALTRQYETDLEKLLVLEQKQSGLDFLEQQVALLNQVKALADETGDTGLVARIFEGVNLGETATPEQLVQAVSRFMDATISAAKESLSSNLASIETDYTQTVDRLRMLRQSVEDIERDAMGQRISALEMYKKEIERLDGEIATAEEKLLNGGGQQQAAILQMYHEMRQRAADELAAYFEDVRAIEYLLERTPEVDNERAQQTISDYRERYIEPLAEIIRQSTSDNERDSLLNALQSQVNVLEGYAQDIADVVRLEEYIANQIEGKDLGERFAYSLEQTLNAIYAIGLDPQQRQELIGDLYQFVGQVSRLSVDLTDALAVSPFAEDFKGRYLDPIFQRLTDINLAEADRNALTVAYQQQLGRLFELEGKQGRLDFIQNQVDLLEKAQALADESGDKGLVYRVFQGISPRTMDSAQLITAVSRLLDETIAQTQKKLAAEIKPPPLDWSVHINNLRRQRRTFEQEYETFFSAPFDPMEDYKNRLATWDEQIIAIEENLTRTGTLNSAMILNEYHNRRQELVSELRTFLAQVKQVDNLVSGIVGNTQIQSLREKFIDPLVDVIKTGAMRTTDRQSWIGTLTNRINQFNELSRLLERLDKLGDHAIVADFRKKTLEPLLDMFAGLSDTSRESGISALWQNIDKLTATLEALEELQSIQKDLSGATSDPLVARFKSDKLDIIAKQLEDINLSEAERNHLIEQYRLEQEKILAIQEKQQQLTFLEQQLALIDKLRKLDDEEGFSVDVESIIGGIGFGVNASIDDLMALLSRVLDETVRFTNQKLGISSPSKVFAKVGHRIMDGLAAGIQDATMRPLMALNQSMQMMPYAMPSARNATLNMHIGSVNNGMDVQMLEARMQGWLDSQFAGI